MTETHSRAMNTLISIDRWLADIESDTRNIPKAQKVAENKPAELVSGCGISGVFVTDLDPCDARYPYFREPRTAAGDANSIYAMKCELKPMDPADYPGVSFTPAQWTALQGAFPTGVCNFARPGVGFQPNVPWLNYQQGPGGQPLPAAPTSIPLQ